jgi:uncharacterized protein (DUF305 family)
VDDRITGPGRHGGADDFAKLVQTMEAGMSQMDRGMAAVPMNGNTDRDFATMRMRRHQGAIEMAKAEPTYGNDPVMRRL